MGRFSKLELEKQADSSAAELSEDRWPDLDEAGCLKLGDEQFHTGRYEPALISYSKALRFNRDTLRGWAGQVWCLICLGEYRESVLWSDRGLERLKDAPELLAGKGLGLVHSGNAEEGMEFLDGAIESRSPSAWVWLARGQALLIVRQPVVNAQHCFLKAVECAPDDWRVDLRIGISYSGAKLYAQARAPVLRAIRSSGDNPLAFYEAGMLHEGLADYGAAAGWYQRALAVRPDYPAASDGLARVTGSPVARWWRRQFVSQVVR